MLAGAMKKNGGKELILTDKKIALVYFSGTHVTHTYAQVMRRALLEQGCEVSLFDVTPYTARQQVLPFSAFDGLIFGFPVYADFAPSVINDWLPTLDGNGQRCTLFFTYGARSTGHAHFHTKLLLEQAGFQVLFTAEFLGRHTFNLGGWQMVPDRPDEQDFVVAREYVTLALESFFADEPREFHLQKPFGYNGAVAALVEPRGEAQRGYTHPIRVAENCSMCRECETECPTRSFDADSGLSDPASCIECCRCVYICPDSVIKVDQRMKDIFEKWLAGWHLTTEMMNAKQSKIITESWQAAA